MSSPWVPVVPWWVASGMMRRAESYAMPFTSRGSGSMGCSRSKGRPTTVKTRVMALHQQIVRVDREDARDFDGEVSKLLLETVRSEIASCGAVAIEDYNKGVLAPCLAAGVLELAEETGVPTIVDPKRRRFSQYTGVTVLQAQREGARGCPRRAASTGITRLDGVRAGAIEVSSPAHGRSGKRAWR